MHLVKPVFHQTLILLRHRLHLMVLESTSF